MSWAKTLLGEQDTEDAKLTELLQLNYLEYDHIVAVEGKDDVEFYNDFLEEAIGSNFLPMSCDNKLGVLNLKKACEGYSWEIRPSLIYICDRDFDGYLGTLTDGVYYTDHYSIESEIAKPKVINYILRRELRPRPSAKVISELVDACELEIAKCARHLKNLACLMIEARSRGLHPEFDDYAFPDFFEVVEDAIVAKEIDYAAIIDAWQIADNSFRTTSLRWEEKLSDESFRNWVRGKYLLQIAKKCLETIVKKRFPGSDRKCSAQVSRDAFHFIKIAISELPVMNSLKATLKAAAQG
ncbi:DUF4435 domain-containing protein [Rhizobium leguminosarum]